METDFYMTLPSNSKATNTPAIFETSLPIKIDLLGEWEVGLAEIVYPNTWYNILDKKCFINLTYKTKTVNIKIPSGRFDTLEDLIQLIQYTLKDVKEEEFKIMYNKEEKRVQIFFDPTCLINFDISPYLTYILGFSEKIHIIESNEQQAFITAEYSPDLTAGMHHLYIYCDILEPQIIGNKLAPLLQVITIRGEYLKTVNQMYVSPHYVPILKSSLNAIEINIKNDENEPIPFQFGNTIIKLHFRKSL